MADTKINLDPVAIGTSILSLVGGLFKSKKHYNIYYWETADNTWKFIFEGHPDQIRQVETQYRNQGYITTIVRNKSGTAIPPTKPPAGYETKAPMSANLPMILIIVAVLAFVLLFVLKKRRKR